MEAAVTEPDSDSSSEDDVIQRIYDLELADTSREAYEMRLKHFVNYLQRTDPGLVLSPDSFDVRRLHIKQFQLFLLWKHEDVQISFNVLKSYRTALVYAFRKAKVEVPSRWTKKLKRFYRGLQRKGAQEMQDGMRHATSGKEAMPFRLYLWLCEYFISKGDIFAWAYLTWAWNSMCRTSNVADIKLSHLGVLQDALGLRVPKSKVDQGGSRANLDWHIYANPDKMSSCPITALGCLLLMDEMRSDEKLFMGRSQERRFALCLQKALATAEGTKILREVNRRPSSISPHSTRKGGAAYASNGTTHAPSFVSITLRAGWSLGDVLSRYFQYDYAMDSFLGRVLAGLDVSSPDFAKLPPHWDEEGISDAVLLRLFPAYGAREDFWGVLRFTLPSVVHHCGTLLKMLPPEHKLVSSPLFTDKPLRRSLTSHLVTGFESPVMKATGVPPHVILMRQNSSIEAKLDTLTDHLMHRHHQEQLELTTLEDSDSSEEELPLVFPKDFALPLVGPLAAWRLLVRGNKSQRLPPFRLLDPKKFPPENRNLRKRISDWLFFYNAVKAQLGDGLSDTTLEVLKTNDDERKLTELFHQAWSRFDFGEAKISVRPDQWKLATAVLKLREMAKK